MYPRRHRRQRLRDQHTHPVPAGRVSERHRRPGGRSRKSAPDVRAELPPPAPEQGRHLKQARPAAPGRARSAAPDLQVNTGTAGLPGRLHHRAPCAGRSSQPPWRSVRLDPGGPGPDRAGAGRGELRAAGDHRRSDAGAGRCDVTRGSPGKPPPLSQARQTWAGPEYSAAMDRLVRFAGIRGCGRAEISVAALPPVDPLRHHSGRQGAR